MFCCTNCKKKYQPNLGYIVSFLFFIVISLNTKFLNFFTHVINNSASFFPSGHQITQHLGLTS